MFRPIVAAAIQGSLFYVVAVLITWILRHDTARLRCRVWTIAIFAQAGLVLLLSTPLPIHLSLPVWRQSTTPLKEAWLKPATSSLHSLSVVVAPQLKSVSDAKEPPRLPWQIATGVWLLGVAICLLRLGVGLKRLRRLSKDSRPLNKEAWLGLSQNLAKRLCIERPVKLTIGNGNSAKIPSTWGFVYPVIYLPETAEKWSSEQREFILLHELIHIKRWDALIDVAIGIITSVFWFDPFVWFAAKRHRKERESACDEGVLSVGVMPSRYAETLLFVERSASQDLSATPGALAALRANELRHRIGAILAEKKANARANRLLRIAALICIPCFCLALASVRATSVTAPRAIASGSSCTIRRTGLIDVTLSVPNAQSVSVAGARNDGQTILTVFDGKSCPTAVFGGEVEISDDLDDIVDFKEPEGTFTFIDASNPEGQAVLISKVHGALIRRYTVAGIERPWSEGHAWFAEELGNLVRDYGYLTSARVKLLLNRGGTEAVLEESRRTRSALGKERLFDALLDQGPLRKADAARIATTVAALEPSATRDALLQRIRAGN